MPSNAPRRKQSINPVALAFGDMAGSSFSLTEKLAVTGAFLALVAMAVGTEDDPGLVATSQDSVKDLRIVRPAGSAAPPTVAELAPPSPLPAMEQVQIPVAAPAPLPHDNRDTSHPDYDPDLGRVPRDFTNGPPED